MLHSREQEILSWLLMRSRRQDRIVYNALNNHQCRPTVNLGTDDQGRVMPVVTVTSRSGVEYRVGVYLHPVTGEPHNFGRLENGSTAETITL